MKLTGGKYNWFKSKIETYCKNSLKKKMLIFHIVLFKKKPTVEKFLSHTQPQGQMIFSSLYTF